MSAFAGAIFVSSRSSIAPRVTPTVLPARSAALFTAVPFGANTAWKNGELAALKSMTFSRSAFLPSVEITRSAFFVCRYAMRLALLTGTSSAFTPSLAAMRFAVSMSRPCGFMSTPTKP